VTGADGFIGSHLVEALVADGARVTALSLYNSFDSHGWLDDLTEETLASVTRIRGDVRDAAFMRRIVDGQEVVFHLAALIAIPHSYAAPQSYVETNVLGRSMCWKRHVKIVSAASCIRRPVRFTAVL